MIAKRRWRDIPRISEELWSELQPTKTRWKDVYVASATLVNGTIDPCAVFVEKDTRDQQTLFPVYGFIRSKYMFDDARMIDAASVVEVKSSPYAIPPEIAEMLEEHGHFDDPIDLARLRLRDGTEYWIRKSWPGFFVGTPSGYSSSDITRVVEWGAKPSFAVEDEMWVEVVNPPPYRLCIFRRP